MAIGRINCFACPNRCLQLWIACSAACGGAETTATPAGTKLSAARTCRLRLAGRLGAYELIITGSSVLGIVSLIDLSRTPGLALYARTFYSTSVAQVMIMLATSGSAQEDGKRTRAAKKSIAVVVTGSTSGRSKRGGVRGVRVGHLDWLYEALGTICALSLQFTRTVKWKSSLDSPFTRACVKSKLARHHSGCFAERLDASEHGNASHDDTGALQAGAIKGEKC